MLLTKRARNRLFQRPGNMVVLKLLGSYIARFKRSFQNYWFWLKWENGRFSNNTNSSAWLSASASNIFLASTVFCFDARLRNFSRFWRIDSSWRRTLEFKASISSRLTQFGNETFRLLMRKFKRTSSSWKKKVCVLSWHCFEETNKKHLKEIF